jgi:dUTPase
MKLIYQKLYADAKPPVKTRDGDIGWDVFCWETTDEYYRWNNSGQMVLPGGAVVAFRTGICCQLQADDDSKQYWLKLETRSSMAKNGTIVLGGIIDPSYTGEIIVVLGHVKTFSPAVITKGDKIAQLVPYCSPIIGITDIQEVKTMPQTDRAGKGFGSSGR